MVDILKGMIEKSRKVVGFTGAGISTESGIPDYRSKGGIWRRYQPVYFQEFVSDESKRMLYWERKWELWPAIAEAEPGPGHLFFRHLFETGKLAGLITQNIDGLHEKSGIPSELIANLHGNALETICLSCGTVVASGWVFETYNLSDGPPACARCGGLLKPNTVSFGQSLDPETLSAAKKMAMSCDLMLILGSTLLVQPAASLPLVAKSSGAKLALITLSETPVDGSADLVLRRKIGEVVAEYGI